MPSSPVDASLLEDVHLLCLDAGNTVVFLDHARIARLCEALGLHVGGGEVERAEGRTKHRLEAGTILEVPWRERGVPGARSWGNDIGTTLQEAGLDASRVAAALEALWPEHRALNLWSLVPPGLVEALVSARRAGVRVAMVSNSEGQLEALLDRLGVMSGVDCVFDSAHVGVEKPDPEIFRVALRAFDVPPGRALHLGDIYATDVLGARAAGVRVALVDPFGHLEGRHDDVPRVPGAREVATALVATREARTE